MAAQVGPVAKPPLVADGFVAAHARLRADGALQFDLPAWSPPQVPEWLIALGRLLKPLLAALAPLAPYARYPMWAAVVFAGLYLAWRLYRHVTRRPRSPTEAETAVEMWRPDAQPARALLREADALAASGRFAEAVQLLLHRSIEEIARHRPELVRPAATSRDIAAAPGLPEPARPTFAAIARAVERARFAGRAIDAAEWRGCRDAYEAFAFPETWR